MSIWFWAGIISPCVFFAAAARFTLRLIDRSGVTPKKKHKGTSVVVWLLASIPGSSFGSEGEALTYVCASVSTSEEPGVIGKVSS
jgi:hypothetical protein